MELSTLCGGVAVLTGSATGLGYALVRTTSVAAYSTAIRAPGRRLAQRRQLLSRAPTEKDLSKSVERIFATASS